MAPLVGVQPVDESLPEIQRALMVERKDVLLRRRYGLAPAQAGGAPALADASADQQKLAVAPQAPAVANPQVALNGANFGRRAVGGAGFGAAGATNQLAVDGRAVLFANQNGAATDDSSVSLARQGRAATSGIVSLAEQRETDQVGTSNTYAYFANGQGAQAGQRYTQVRRYRVNLNSPPMPNVLRTFQVEQSGQQMRVVDADGSVYDGAIEPPAPEEFAKRSVAAQTVGTDLKKNIELEAKPDESVSAATAGEMAASQNVFFHVAGTNRTLNQRVVFQGNFLANMDQTNGVFLGAKLEASQAAAAPQQNESLQRQQLSNALIQGQATIGDRNRVQINASPVGP